VDIVMMLDRAPGNNRDFVMAIKLLQNCARLVDMVMKGQGGLANDHPIGPAYRVPLESLGGAEWREFTWIDA
jgi:hypothetical protein